MKKIIKLVQIPVLCCLLAVSVHARARQFKIEWEFEDAGSTRCVTLVDLKDQSVVWENSYSPAEEGKFAAYAKAGNYVLCMSCGPFYYGHYFPVRLTSDVDLGLIAFREKHTILGTEILLFGGYGGNGFGHAKEKRGQEEKLVLKSLKNYDVFDVLTSFYGVHDFRIAPETSRIAKVEIDGVALKKNIFELIDYLKNMSAKNVDYIDKLPPTKKNPGGTIRIVTSDFFKIDGSVHGERSFFLVLKRIADDAVVWRQLFKASENGKPSNECDFSVYCEKGKYELLLTSSLAENKVALQLDVASDVDLGVAEFRGR